jgi:hypothetical protein
VRSTFPHRPPRDARSDVVELVSNAPRPNRMKGNSIALTDAELAEIAARALGNGS